jgi:tRNA nucleotidyltransferase/poly(A) polymerase
LTAWTFDLLRADEIYEEHSRIPECSFGNAGAGAAHGFNCNALQYPIRSRGGLDGCRVARLIAGELVTPLEPVQFRDDPLSALRAIRFAVRYHFKLDPALEAAAVLPEIANLALKVSRERVGKGVESMLSGKTLILWRT